VRRRERPPTRAGRGLAKTKSDSTAPGSGGHFAGGGVNPTDTKFIDDSLKELLAQEV